MAAVLTTKNGEAAQKYADYAEHLSLLPHHHGHSNGPAVEAKFVSPQDPIIATANGGRLPAVPVEKAQELNRLKDEAGEQDSDRGATLFAGVRQDKQKEDAAEEHLVPTVDSEGRNEPSPNPSARPEAPLRAAIPPAETNPLFPPLPLYGPPTFLRNLQCAGFRVSSFFLSVSFLAVIVLGSAFTSIPLMFRHVRLRMIGQNTDARRPFHEEEVRRKKARRKAEKEWERKRRYRDSGANSADVYDDEEAGSDDEYKPLEGGKDRLKCDVGYYARRVGLDVEKFKAQTEDGFIIDLWHVFNPKEYNRLPDERLKAGEPQIFCDEPPGDPRRHSAPGSRYSDSQPRYPVLLIHGLLQSSGAYCVNDDDSLAFFLCKSGYDVWLGNNRCGFQPEHQLLQYSDPRMWSWNLRQMGILDLPALISRVLVETGFEKLGLVCHSQGTAETFVALAKEQRPDLGHKISVFCALAPAAYAGPLIGKAYLKFIRLMSPPMFRVFFGIHAFIPLMMTMHRFLPGRLYGAMGYRVFSFLFNWTDTRWERDTRNRKFQFAPVYVSAESMRWWLGRECFAKHKCILATHETSIEEDEEDEEEDCSVKKSIYPTEKENKLHDEGLRTRKQTAWYDEQVPPFALWIGGSDELVDGRRLLRRFDRGREPHVRVVHSKIIEEYEHLDVIWAMDSIDQVGKEVRQVLWSTAPACARKVCRVPKACEDVAPWEPQSGSSSTTTLT
ncbi:Partial AB-hydrolase lipase domain [Lasallia pustulata]|uniref:Partial AB-hydrolase lipase domain n=1 Tax=Lasallia pustulata TaxID=136370 RepID=A0A1W5D3T2_9LECA|nr:Partial AB-hydrolase lipase domain [Lasallia pustulata]